MVAEYLKEYLRKYAGRGIPVTVDVLIATRCASTMGGGGGVSDEKFKEVRDMAKAARAETASLKNELNQVKSELNRLKSAGGKGGGGEGGGSKDANITCNYCKAKGHRWATCPKRLAEEAEKEEGGEKE
jgi:hypothetical protein